MRSFVILGTNRFEAMVSFYRERLGLMEVDSWDQPDGRGVFLELPGLLVKIVDNDRERIPLILGASLDRVGLVVEVDDIVEARDFLDIETPIPNTTTLGARQFQVRDPDGLPVTFLQRTTQH
jgi:catechol 2,3-dioxygenase-like lactoylglutathione lyase family enzyme